MDLVTYSTVLVQTYESTHFHYRYLSSGDLMQDIALSFRVGISTARLAVRVTCRALWTRLQPLYLAVSTVALKESDCDS